MTFAAIVPLKSTSRGKSRLRLPAERRAALALAMARDTVAAIGAAREISRVVLVLEDGHDATRFVGADVDRLVWSQPGLNRSIAAGARALTASGWAGPVAVLPADLPFLRPDELDGVLPATAGQARVVADGVGIGTTLLTAPLPAALRPRFGPDSFARHQRAGAVAMLVDRGSGLRRDVDVLADLIGRGSRATPGTYTQAVIGELPATGSAQVTVLP